MASGDISRVINRKKEGEVTLTIIRNRTQQTMRVLPLDGGLHGGTIGGPQIGRRIVIPRIELGTVPEINISMPSIELPTIPSIDIQMPRIRVPNVRVIKTSRGPILFRSGRKGLLVSCHLTFISCQFEEKRKSLFENKHFELSSICLFAPKRPKLITDKCQMTTDQ